MEPVSLLTKDEETFFLNLVRDSTDHAPYTYWHIGGKRQENSNEWVWHPLNKQIDYDIGWAYGEPNNYTGSEKCLSVKVNPSRTGLNDINCNRENYMHYAGLNGFFCQIVEIPEIKKSTELLLNFNRLRDIIMNINTTSTTTTTLKP